MKRFAFLPVLALALTAACQDVPTAPRAVQAPIAPRLAAAFTTITNITFPVNQTVWAPCAAEYVTFTGQMHEILRITWNANNFAITGHVNPQNVSGTGSVTGDTYRSVGVVGEASPGFAALGKQNGSFVNGSYNFTGVYIERFIGQGSGNNLLVHDNMHGTINANGEVTVSHDNFSAECR